MLKSNNVKMGLKDGLPIAIGYFAISFALGFFASGLGISWVEAFFISMFNLTSAGEIAAIPIIAAGGSLFELALSQLVINSRYALMSVSLSQKLDETVRVRDRFLIAFFNTDEIFAVACGKDTPIGKKYFLALGILPMLGWSFGTMLGALIGGVLPALITESLSVAIYAMLIAVVVPAAKTRRPTAICVLLAAAISFAFELVPVLHAVPSGIAIVLISVTISAVFAVIAPVSEEEPEKDEVSV